MKRTYSFAAAGTLVWLVGCASPPKVTQLPPVGPSPTAAFTGLQSGTLQVYSARAPSDISLRREIYFWNADFGRNDFLYGAAHTDYTINSQNGQVVEQVRNAKNYQDSQPALVTLPPGLYTVQAKAEEEGGGTINLSVPVQIEPGKCTRVYLSSEWRPAKHYTDSEVVRLPTGQIAGWRATASQPMHEPGKSPG